MPKNHRKPKHHNTSTTFDLVGQEGFWITLKYGEPVACSHPEALRKARGAWIGERMRQAAQKDSVPVECPEL